MLNYKGAIFDLDGTLIDSMHVWKQIDIDFLGKRGLDVPDDYVEAIAAMGYMETAHYTIKRFDLNEKAEDIVNEWKEMAIDAYTNNIRIKAGVNEYLEFLKQNNVKMAIATASDLSLVIPVLKSNCIEEYFDNITTLSEVNRGKGFPDIYNLAAQRLGLEANECYVFEDIIQGIQGANMGGYTSIAVYDKWSEKDKEMLGNNAFKYIQDFYEMIEE